MFGREDMVMTVVIDEIDHREQRIRFTLTRRPRDQHQTLVHHGDVTEHLAPC